MDLKLPTLQVFTIDDNTGNIQMFTNEASLTLESAMKIGNGQVKSEHFIILPIYQSKQYIESIESTNGLWNH